MAEASTAPPKQRELPSPPSDTISAATFSPHSNPLLIVSSWDSKVHLYDTDGTGKKLSEFTHKAPVLDTCWGNGDNELFSSGLDWTVNQIDPETNTPTLLHTSTAAIPTLTYHPSHSLLISGSWSRQLTTLDPRQSSTSQPPQSYTLPNKILTLTTTPSSPILTVAMSHRLIHLYDLRAGLSTPLQTRESSLKFQTRCVAPMPDGLGYATSSIEGRVAVEYFDASAEVQAKKYAFKCHRQEREEANEGEDGARKVDVVYPVNALAWHPRNGCFVSGGGDGVVSLWDGAKKRRVRQFVGYGASVAAVGWSKDGGRLAVGTSGGFEDGREGGVCPQDTVRVFVREVGEREFGKK